MLLILHSRARFSRMLRPALSHGWIPTLAGVWLLAASAAGGQTTWYVDDNGPNDPGPGDPTVSDPNENGSPEHPFDAIQEGIDAAVNGDTVLVLDGAYTGVGNKDLDFDGKAITVRSDNGPQACIIDCEHDGRGFYFRSGEGETSVVNGLTITNGRTDDGGAVYCDGSSPTLTNCVLTENHASRNGGGMFNWDSSPTVTNCTFSTNSARWVGGGGMYNHESNPTVTSCTFTTNSAAQAGSGAGMLNAYSSPTVTNCTFSANSADLGGGGMANYYDSSPAVVDCTFAGNLTYWAGGAMYNIESAPLVSDCLFAGNWSGHNAGGMFSLGREPTVVNCTFRGNFAQDFGGGMRNDECSPAVTNCTFSWNSAGDRFGGGGGMHNEESTPTVTNCVFDQNSGGWGGGGGMYNEETTATVANCTFTRNSAEWYGAGMLNRYNSRVTVTNCTFGDNETEVGGGGIANLSSIATLSNCILWGNYLHEIYDEPNAPPWITVATYCDIDDGWPGIGNIDAAPDFIDPGDYRLDASSPCIDAGCNWGVARDVADLDHDGDTDEFTPLDLDGEGRFFDHYRPEMPDTGCGVAPLVDMGAYEFGDTGPQPCFGDLNGDRVVDLADLATMLPNYGETDVCDGDLDCDGDVDLMDLAALLAVYRTTCE